MEDHSSRDARRGVLPVPLLGTVLSRADDHVRHVVRIRNVSCGKQAQLGQWIETGTPVLFYRREFEAQMSLLCTEAGGLCPILALDVVNDCRFGPCEQGW